MSTFVTIGEPLVVFASTDKDKSLSQSIHFNKYLAGAELNVAVGVARLGHSVSYVTQVGRDSLGDFILGQLEKNNIDNRNVKVSEKYATGFYFKNNVSVGDPDIEYFRSNSAAAHFSPETIDSIELTQTRVVHLSGIMAAISNDGYQAVEALLNNASQSKIISTFDPNLRLMLWPSRAEMISKINNLARKAQIVLPGVNEGKILVGSENPAEIAAFYLEQSLQTNLVIVKNGHKGVYVKERGQEGFKVKAYRVNKVIDTVGAGDGFVVGVITGLLEGCALPDAVKRGCAIGALAVQSAGDNDGYPDRQQLNYFMESQELV